MSNENEEQELIFHYNREERLENASQTVKDYYNGTGPTPPKGIFEALVHTKSSRYALFALLLVLAFFVGFYFFGAKSYEDTLNGIHYKLSAFNFEDKVYVSIKLDSKDETEIAPHDISIQIFVIDNENQIVDKKILSQNDIKDSYLRTVFTNHDIIKVTAEITGTEEEISKKIDLSCKVGNEK